MVAAVHRAQAQALEIEAAAKRRLADEYDAAQERGEVATRQNNPGSVGHVPKQNMPATASDLGLTRQPGGMTGPVQGLVEPVWH